MSFIPPKIPQFAPNATLLLICFVGYELHFYIQRLCTIFLNFWGCNIVIVTLRASKLGLGISHNDLRTLPIIKILTLRHLNESKHQLDYNNFITIFQPSNCSSPKCGSSSSFFFISIISSPSLPPLEHHSRKRRFGAKSNSTKCNFVDS